MKVLLSIICLFMSVSVSAREVQDRVPYVFTGDSQAPEYQHYNGYKYTEDSRDSRDYAEYYLISEQRLNDLRASEGLQNIHVHVRNIALDGLCGDYTQCFRAYVFANGDEETGVLLATFVVSPGTGYRTPTVENKPVRQFTRSLYSYERNTQYKNLDMYRVYGSKSYPGRVANMPNAIFFLTAIAIHGSFDKVNGAKQSHGCIRMNPDESYWLHGLVIETGGQFTIDVLHTRQ